MPHEYNSAGWCRRCLKSKPTIEANGVLCIGDPEPDIPMESKPEDDTIVDSVQRMCYSYLEITKYFSEAWKRNEGELTNSDIKNYNPSTSITRATDAYNRDFMPLAMKHYHYLHSANESNWSQHELNSRFLDTYKPLLDATIVPLLQTALSHDVAEFYAIQAQIASIQQEDPDIFGAALRGFSLAHGNILAAPSLIGNIADIFGVGPQSERLDHLMALDKEKSELLTKRCTALVEAVVEILDKWENQVDEEIKLTNRMSELSKELDTEKQNVAEANRAIKERDRVITRQEKTITEKDKLIERFIAESDRQQEEIRNLSSGKQPERASSFGSTDVIARLEKEVQSLKVQASLQHERKSANRSIFVTAISIAAIGALIAIIVWIVKS